MSLSNSRFGRLHKPDEGDKKFLVAPVKKVAENIVSKYHYTDLVLDQGYTSKCVGAAGRGWLTAGPVRNMSGMDFHQLYVEAQQVDEWPGAEPDYFGTSVRALFKVLKKQGVVSEYNWAFSLEPAVNHVLTVGPMVLGTTWFQDQMEPDKDGFIHAGGKEAGGHAYLMIGAHREKKCPDGSRGAARIVNSWGRSWGENGRAWISFNDLSALIADQGEAATATEVKAAVPKAVA